MKGVTIILDHLGEREAAARVVDGRLDDLLIEDVAPGIGTIYRALADRPMKGQGGMMLRGPDGSLFLRQIKGLSPGQPLLVQVTGRAEAGKAVPVTTKLLFKSRYAIVTPDAPGLNISRSIRDDDLRDALMAVAHSEMEGDMEGDMGLILRSACAGASEEDIAEDIRAMADLARSVLADLAGAPELLAAGDGPHVLAWRDWTEEAEVVTEAGGFAARGVDAMIADARGPYVPLGAGHMYIEPTRALVAVDVNTGSDTSPAAGLKANIAAARDLPRQLRLRGLGGQIVIDAAPMAKKDRHTWESTLRAAFRADLVETSLVGWTPLGHYELHRKRDRVPLAEVP